MRNKKSNKPEISPEQEALEKSVDSMMDPRAAADPDAMSIKVNVKPSSMPVETKADAIEQQTAPELPDKLLKQIPVDAKASDTPAEPAKAAVAAPIVIDGLEKVSAEVENQDEPAEPASGEPEPDADADAELESDFDSTNLEDDATNRAVDDIAEHEGDTALAIQDAKAARSANAAIVSNKSGFKDKLSRILKSKWTWIIVGLAVVIVFALPQTRYTILGLVIKKTVTVQVTDSKTATPVSNAKVVLGGATTKTDGNGKAKLNAKLGQSELNISKRYYQTSSTKYFVGFKSAPTTTVKLVATGRLVPIKVTNKITGKPLAGAQITVLGTTAKTDSKGQAIIALPAKTNTEAAKLSAPGYNTASITLQVTDKTVVANSFTLTPAGQVYFLSNLSGVLDVVKANLDGTGRKTVLAGTGREDKANTSLLASRDWKYLVLKARRDSAQPALYLIDTSNDKVTPFDNSDSTFTLVGWYNHNFVYDLVKNNQPQSQAGREALKSYDADHLQINQLDQNQVDGDASSYGYQSLSNFYLLNGVVAYNTQWYASNGSYNLSGKTDTIRVVQPNGQNKKDYQTFPSGTIGFIQAALSEPQSVYYSVRNDSDSKTTYYEYQNQSVKTVSNIDQSTFSQAYPTYLLSPTGTQTFWTDLRDGKNTLFLGDANAGNPKQIATLSSYAPYGWFTEAYTLVSKNSSELYIMPAGGVQAGQQPTKITDYYKPAQSLNGYGYGYGGL